MNKKQMQFVLKDLTEQKAPAAQIDLWPAIQSHIQMSQSKQSKGSIMNTHSDKQHRRLNPAFILLGVILVGAIFFLLPQGRALAQGILHYFNRGESNVMPGPTSTPVKWVEQTPGVPVVTFTPPPPPAGPAFEADCGSYSLPHCTIEAIRERVSFPVFALAELPDKMNFTGATGGPDGVYLLYTAADRTGILTISEEPFAGDVDLLAWEVAADADIQSVQVGAVTAEYLKGSYDGSSEPPVWNPDLDVQMLRWLDQGILYNLEMLGTAPRLGRDELAALAASLTDGPVGVNGSLVAETEAPTAEPFDFHTVYPLSLAEAEAKAGFALLSPSRLPETLSLIGANYDEETRVVKLFYHYNYPSIPDLTDGLLISEQLAPQEDDCDLCGFIQGDGKQVERYAPGKLVSKDAKIETIQIGDFTGQYLEGIGWTSRDESGGWQWNSEPYVKKLRIRTDELAIEVSFFGMEIARADLISIAEDLK